MDPVLSVSYATIAAFLRQPKETSAMPSMFPATAIIQRNPDAKTFCSFPVMTADRSYCRLRMQKAFWELR